VLIGAQVEGSVIPEAVPVEGVVLEAEVIKGAATEPAETTAPGATEEVHGRSRPLAGNPRRGADQFGADVRGRSD
jgi:hypothetical protein